MSRLWYMHAHKANGPSLRLATNRGDFVVYIMRVVWPLYIKSDLKSRKMKRAINKKFTKGEMQFQNNMIISGVQRSKTK